MACADCQDKPQAWLMDNGARLHLQHGPIDVILQASGSPDQIQKAYRQACLAFQSVLDTLASQLTLLRSPLLVASDSHIQRGDALTQPDCTGEVAQSMMLSAGRITDKFITPMVAVAGAVADYLLNAAWRNCQLQRLHINNGGDIALRLTKGEVYRIGICRSVLSTQHADIVTIRHGDPVAGVATSGWQGRSHSLGIADAVTVLASDAASADVGATMIANEVDLPGSPKVERAPAIALAPDSDLGERLVTTKVACLSDDQKGQALQRGLLYAKRLRAEGLIHSAYLHLQGQSVIAAPGADIS